MSFIWDKSYNIGISEIDNQHEHFVNMLNRMQEAYKDTLPSSPSDEVKMKVYLDILNLRKYALNHFSMEEKYMVNSKYPKFFDHKKQHDAFIRKVLDLEDELLESQGVSPQNLISFMLSWFEGHIQKVDKDFGIYYKVMAGGKT